jgi:hypothetical protein
MIGFLDENQYRSYPLQPVADRRLRAVLTDAHIFYGPDAQFDIERDQCVLLRVYREGVDWMFELQIRRDGLLRLPLLVRVGDGSPVFSTHHAASADGWSYAYLTVGDLRECVAYQAPSVGEAPALEDRCVVAPGFTVVRSIEAANGKKNFSFRTVFRYVSANPGTNYGATREANPPYDPYAYDQSAGPVLPPEMQMLGGQCANVTAKTGTLLIGLLRGGGTGFGCERRLPDDQTSAGTFRTYMGRPTNGRGDLRIEVGQGLQLENLPDDHTVRLIALDDRPSNQCVRPTDTQPPVLPEPPA